MTTDRLPATPPFANPVATTWAAIWELAWPLVLTMVMNALIGLLDTWVAGRFDATSQAAVGLTNQIVLLINAATTAASIGCQALVSRFVGAGSWDDAGKTAQQTLILGAALTVLLLLPMFAFAPELYRYMGATPAVQSVGVGYMRLLLPALLPMDLAILISSIFRARGRMTPLLIANCATNGTWACGSLGLGLFAGWGVPGLAMAFTVGHSAGFCVAWLLYRRSRVHRHMPPGWRPSKVWFKRILSIGLPAGIQVMIRNLGMMAYFGILNQMANPTETVAAFSIGTRIESLAFLPVFALNIATATLVGQNLGAERPEEARRTAWKVAAVGTMVMAIFGVIFYVFAHPLAAIFTRDPVVQAFTARYLQVVSISEPMLGLVMVLNGALQGAGATRPPMFFTFGAQICFRLPLSYLLAVNLHWGSDGAWWGFTASMFVQAAAVVTYFTRGRWLENRV
jgi:putative MATE family efflux protein